MKHIQLMYFITLAQRLHYTQAANALGISQPALSHAIANLELDLGFKLFVKSGRNVVLTDCGKMFLETAKESVEVLADGIQKVKMLANDIQGEVTIGHMYLHQNAHLLKYINGYKEIETEQLPLFNFEYNIAANIIKGIQEDEYDIGFCFKGEGVPDVEFIPIKVDRLVLVVPPEHELASFSEVSISDIVDYPHVFYNKNSFLHSSIDEYFRSIRKSPNISCTVKEVSTLVGMVESGMGIGIAPESFICKDSKLVRIELSKVSTTRVIYLAYAKNKYLCPAVKRVVNYIKENHAISL